jgi:hypothetical protein
MGVSSSSSGIVDRATVLGSVAAIAHRVAATVAWHRCCLVTVTVMCVGVSRHSPDPAKSIAPEPNMGDGL